VDDSLFAVVNEPGFFILFIFEQVFGIVSLDIETRISTNCSMEVILALSLREREREREFSHFCAKFVQSALFIFHIVETGKMVMKFW